MVFAILQKGVRYTKQVQDIGLFGTMMNSRWFIAFGGSPLYFIMLPLIGILVTIMALMNGYELAKSHNKNFEKWFDFIVAVIAAVCASVSLYGAVIATYLGVSFVAGPWVFFASLIVASIHQSFMLGLHLFRAFTHPKNSMQRQDNIQAAIDNVFVLSLIAAAIGTVAFVMLFPVMASVGSIFAIAVVALTAADIIWHIAPDSWRQVVKDFIFGKPDLIIKPLPLKPLNLDLNLDSKTLADSYGTLFKTSGSVVKISVLTVAKSEELLRERIEKKLKVLSQSPAASSDKNTQKAHFLKNILTHMEQHQVISKTELLKQYPLALQSFWAEKGEVEQILDEALFIQEGNKQQAAQKPETPTIPSAQPSPC